MVSGYFQEGSEEAIQKAMEIAADSGREIEVEDAIKYPSVLHYGEIDAAEYLANRTLSDVPPKPEDFLGKGIRFTMGIDWEHIDSNKIYIIYYTDAEKFDGFTLLLYKDWYVAWHIKTKNKPSHKNVGAFACQKYFYLRAQIQIPSDQCDGIGRYCAGRITVSVIAGQTIITNSINTCHRTSPFCKMSCYFSISSILPSL